MSNYTQSTSFTTKDGLTSGDPNKLIKGADFDAEFAAIATAIATKLDSSSLSSNAGMLADIQALTDPGADRILFWDDSAGAVSQLAPDGTSIAISGTTISTGSNVPLLNAANVFSATQRISNIAPIFELYDSDAGSDEKLWRERNVGGTWALSAYDDAGSSGNNAITVGRSGTTVGTIALAGTSITLNGVASSDFARLSAANAFSTSAALMASFNSTDAAGPYLSFKRSNTDFGFIGNGGQMGSGYTADAIAIVAVAGKGVEFGQSGDPALKISGTGNFNFFDGTVTTNNASASEVGKTGAPSRNVSASTNTAASDQGGMIRLTGGSGQTFTLDSDIPADCFVIIINSSGNPWTIAATGTLTFGGATGSRTLATGCMAVFVSAGSGNYQASGQLS